MFQSPVRYVDDTTASLPPPPALTDEDVQLLQTIIDRAQRDAGEHPNHPRKALLDAYEAVFTLHGLDTNHDRACLQAILQMGASGGTLVQRFDEVLKNRDIEIEYEDDVGDEEEEEFSSRVREMEYLAIEKDAGTLKLQTVRLWRQRVQKLRADLEDADADYRRKICVDAFKSMRLKLREIVTQRKIDDRVAKYSLRKLQLTYRERLFGRQRDERIAREGFALFNNGTKRFLAKNVESNAAADTFKKIQDVKLLVRALGSTQQAATLNKQREQAADNYYVPKLQSDTFVAIKTRISEIQDQQQRADLARYYLISRRTIKIWLARALKGRQDRLKREKMEKEAVLNELYKFFRGKYKKKLIRKIFNHWVDRTRIIRDHQRTALTIWDQKEAKRIHAILTKWYGTVDYWLQMAREASDHYEHRLASQTLSSVTGAGRQLRTMQNRADQFHNIHLSDTAQHALRRLAMKAFLLQQGRDSADAFHNRTDRQHRRNMVQHWSVRTQDRVRQSLQQQPSVVDTGYVTDTDHDEQPASVPVPATAARPGYLNTPAARRSRALANLSTTPAISFATRLQTGMTTPAPQEQEEQQQDDVGTPGTA